MNFYSYAPRYGMSYHPTKELAIEAAEAHVRDSLRQEADPRELEMITWGEVTARATPTGTAGYALKRQDRLSYEAEYPQVIDGRMMTGDGDLRLLQNIHEADLLEHDLVLSIACIWLRVNGMLQRFKQYNFEDVTAFADLLYDKYKVKRGGAEKGITLCTVDRKFKLVISIQKRIDFGPEIMVAEDKMLAAVEQMGGDADIKALVTAAYTKVDGKLCVAKILSLRSIKISSPLWNEAMQIVNDAIEVIGKKKQIRLYVKDRIGQYDSVPLDIAAL